MRELDLRRWAKLYFAALSVASVGLWLTLRVSRHPAQPESSIVSVWKDGRRIARKVVSDGRVESALKSMSAPRGATRIVEDVLDSAPVLPLGDFVFAASFVPARDGVEVRYDDRIAYATPDDLLKASAYELGFNFGNQRVKLGLDPAKTFAYLAGELGVSVEELRVKGRFRRLAMSRRPTPGEEHAPKVDRNSLREAVLGAGEYLARNVRLDGAYAYEIDGQSGEESPDYNLPRHSGATWFLAEAAGYSRDPKLERSVRRAARYLSRTALVDCGERRCIAQREQADLGSSALALLAFAELVQNGVAPELLQDAVSLAEFLVSQQRPDGEFKHLYDRVERHPIDVQLLYYTGEASYALSKIYRITHDPRYLAAARGALAHLVKQPIWAPALRYYWGAEHWTCHALEDLWDAAPNPEALEFCLRWLEFVGRTAVSGREVAPEYDGASATGPFLPPQLVATATRLEAAVATLAVARKAKLEAARVERLETEIRAAFRFLMRYQFLPGPMHLMVDPERMYGGVPASETDFRVRIDYPQHAGTGLLAYLKLLEQGRRAPQ